MTAHQGELSLTTQYLLDYPANARPLAATANSQTTFYLYGNGPLAELKADWTYYLSDGTGTVRQLTDSVGTVTLSRSYTPWGELLEQSGDGEFTWGYFGGLLDAATGLIYVGGGQYYDPATGRFLTRFANPGAINPYVPMRGNPLGAMLGPLALLFLLHRRRKKPGKYDHIFIGLVLILAFGMGLVACDGTTFPGGTTPPVTTPPPGGGTPVPPNTEPPANFTPPSGSPTPTPSPTCTPTPTLPPVATGTATIFFGGSDGQSVQNPGPDPYKQTPVWAESATQVIPYPGGSKAAQANAVDVNAYKDTDLIVIGYSAGADAALMFSDKYRINQTQNNGVGKITDVAVLGGTMSGTMTDGRDLAQVWPGVLDSLLIWGTDIYILDDKAQYGNEASGYQAPPDAIGTFHFESRTDQEHWDGGLDGNLGIGTNNSAEFKAEVFSWFASH